MKEYNEIVNIIRSVRQNKGINVISISDFLDISHSHYTMKENESAPFTFSQFIQVCEYLNLNLKMYYFNKSNEEVILNNNYEDVVKSISSRRKELNYTLDSFRVRIGLSYPTYANKENLKSPKEFYLIDILKIFKELDIKLQFSYSYIAINCTKENYDKEFNL